YFVTTDSWNFGHAAWSAASAKYVFDVASGSPRDLPSFPTRRSSDLPPGSPGTRARRDVPRDGRGSRRRRRARSATPRPSPGGRRDRKSTRLNSSHVKISYAVFCLKKKKRRYISQNVRIILTPRVDIL